MRDRSLKMIYCKNGIIIYKNLITGEFKVIKNRKVKIVKEEDLEQIITKANNETSSNSKGK